MFLLIAAMSIVSVPLQARHDADCAEAASWALSWMGNRPHDEAVENVRNVNFFFMGRLTARDESVDWVMSLSRDMHVNPRPSEEAYSARLSQCTSEMSKILVTPAAKEALFNLPPDSPHR